jgi:hypothetical protein
MPRSPRWQGKREGDESVSVTQTWILLIVAGLMAIGWAIGLKYTDGFTRL